MTEIAKLIITADASDLKKAEDSLRTLAETSEKSEAKIRGSASKVTDSLQFQAQAFERLRASVDPLFSASKQYESALVQVDRAVKAGVASQRDAALVLSMAAQKYLSLGDSMEQASSKVERLTVSVKASVEAITGVSRSTSSASESTKEWVRDLNAQATSFDRLRSSIDPVFAASKQYEMVVEQTNQAVRAGIVSQREASLVLEMASAKYLSAATAARIAGGAAENAGNQASRGMSRITAAATNASFQVQDFAVQIAGGTAATTAFAQQLPQLLGAFGFAGTIGLVGAALGTLVAIIGAVVPALWNMDDATNSAESSVSKLGQALTIYENASINARGVTQELREEFKGFADEVQRTSELMVSVGIQTAQSAVQQIVLGDSFQNATEKVANFNAAAVSYVQNAAIAAAMPDAQAALANMQRGLEAHRQAAIDAAAALYLLPPQVEQLSAALANFHGAKTISEMRDSSQALLETFDRLYPAGARIPDALLPALPIIEELRNKFAKTEATVNSTSSYLLVAIDHVRSLVSAASGLPAQFNAANGSAARLSNTLATAAKNAWSIAMARVAEVKQAGLNYGAIQNRYGSGADMAAREAVARMPDIYSDVERAANRAAAALAKPETGGGGGGGSLSEAAKEAEKALKESEKAAEEYAKALNAPLASAIDGLSNAIGNLFTEFKFESFFKSLVSTFKSSISQMIAFSIANPIKLALGIGGVGGAAGAVASAAGGVGGGGGIGGALSGLLGSGGAVGGLMSGLTGVLQQGGILGTLGQSFGAAGGLLTGSIGGLGAIGAALPAIGLVVGVLAALKGKKTITGTRLEGSIGGGGAELSSATDVQTKRLFGLIKSTKTNKSSQDASDLAAAAAGIVGNVGAYGSALGLANRGAAVKTSFSINTQGMSPEQAQAALTAELERYGNAVADATLGTRQYSREGESSLATLERLVNSMAGVNAVMDNLGHGFRAIGLHGAGAAASLADLFGGLENFQSAASRYYELFYSDTEKFASTARQASSALAVLGAVMPKNRDEYRKMVEAQDLNTDTGRRLYATLVSLAGAMDTLLPKTENLIDTLNSALGATTDKLTQALSGLSKDLGQAVTDWRGVSESIIDFLYELSAGENSINGVRQRVVFSQEAYSKALDASLAGNVEAAKSLTGMAGTYLENARKSASSAFEYTVIEKRVANELMKVSDSAIYRASVAQLTLDAITGLLTYIQSGGVEENIINGFATQITFLKGAVDGANAVIASAVAGSYDAFAVAFGDLLTGYAEVGGRMTTGLASLLDSFAANGLKLDEGLGALLNQFTSFDGTMTAGFGSTNAALGTGFGSTNGVLQIGFTTLGTGLEAIGGNFGAVGNALGAISGGLTGIGAALGSTFTTALEALNGSLGSSFLSGVSALAGQFAGVGTTLGSILALTQQHVELTRAMVSERQRQEAEAAAEAARQAAAAEAARQAAAAAAAQAAAASAAEAERQRQLAAAQAAAAATVRKPQGFGPGVLGIAKWNAENLGGQYVAQYQRMINGFAAGGVHGGGLAVVGEQGPELVDMAPARVYSNTQSKQLLNLDPVISELKALREENRQLQTNMIILTQRMARTQSDWDKNGLPVERTA